MDPFVDRRTEGSWDRDFLRRRWQRKRPSRTAKESAPSAPRKQQEAALRTTCPGDRLALPEAALSAR